MYTVLLGLVYSFTRSPLLACSHFYRVKSRRFSLLGLSFCIQFYRVLYTVLSLLGLSFTTPFCTHFYRVSPSFVYSFIGSTLELRLSDPGSDKPREVPPKSYLLGGLALTFVCQK